MAIDPRVRDRSQKYRLGIPKVARARIEQKLAESELKFRLSYQELSKKGQPENAEAFEELLVELASARFFAFVQEAIDSDADTFTVRKSLESYLPILVDRVLSTNYPCSTTTPDSERLARLRSMVQSRILNSPDWLELQRALLRRSERELIGTTSTSGVDVQTTENGSPGGTQDAASARTANEAGSGSSTQEGREQLTANPSGLDYLKAEIRSGAPDADAVNRRNAINAYIEEVLRRTGKRLTRTDIWKSAGYKSRTEFERWERNDKDHPNKSADQNFRRVLNVKPHLK